MITITRPKNKNENTMSGIVINLLASSPNSCTLMKRVMIVGGLRNHQASQARPRTNHNTFHHTMVDIP